jgi:sec-independent protein translocase protein TatC
MGQDQDHEKTLDPIGTMSLGDHLEELRMRLVLALSGLAVGMVVGLVFGGFIIDFLERPYLKAMADFSAKAVEDPNLVGQTTLIDLFCSHLLQELEADPNAPDLDPTTVRYLQGVYRKTIATEGLSDLVTPKSLDNDRAPLQILGPAEGIISYIKIALIAGLIISSPWVFQQIWLFIAAGLYPHEKRFVHLAAPFSAGLFISGAVFFMFVVAPLTLGFLIKFNASVLNVQSNFTFSYYISFITMLTLVFGLAFQTPIAIFFLNRTGIVSIASLKASRKFAILGIVIVAAMVTPPDVVSQVTLAIPIYLLYELGILISAHDERKRNTDPSSAT